ncbi:MAG: Ig-like domain-containing protein, partial [Treponema sp.]|nr:Ig-like domain-containing protein [Treponema sp.]
MKKFWKSLALLLCLLAGFGFVVTGCSDGDDDGGSGGGSTPVVNDPSGVVIPELTVTDTYSLSAGTKEAAYEDASLYIKFDSAPTINAAQSVKGDAEKTKAVKILKSDGTVVDTIYASKEQIVSQASNASYYNINVQDQLISVNGNVVVIKRHPNIALAASTQYYVTVDAGLFTGKVNGTDFAGISDATTFTFTTRAAPVISGTEITIGKDKNFSTIQAAFDYLAANAADDSTWKLNIDKGYYNERLSFAKAKVNVEMIGSSDADNKLGAKTVIYWKNNNGKDGTANEGWNPSSRSRTAFLYEGNNLTVKHLTFANTIDRKVVGKDGTQAEAFYYDAKGYLVAYDCSFKSHQDTLLLGNQGGRGWFYKCYIEGDTDFIWGYPDVVLFEECDIRCLYDYTPAVTNHTSYIFASRAMQNDNANKGLVLFNSNVKVDNGVTAYFGRNSGSDTQAAVVFNKFSSISPTLWYDGATKYDEDIESVCTVGYKDYGNTDSNGAVLSTASRKEGTYGLSKYVAEREYCGRNAILNRGWNATSRKYEATTVQWDLSALETEFSASEDKSKNMLYLEPTYIPYLEGKSSSSAFVVKNYKGEVADGLTFSVDKAELATVSDAGVVTAKENQDGELLVTATKGTQQGIARVIILKQFVPATGLAFDKTAAFDIDKDDSVTLTAAFTPAETTDKNIIWTSSNTNVLRVQGSGATGKGLSATVTGFGVGTAKITATSEKTPSVSTSITITVKEVYAARYLQESTGYNLNASIDHRDATIVANPVSYGFAGGVEVATLSDADKAWGNNGYKFMPVGEVDCQDGADFAWADFTIRAAGSIKLKAVTANLYSSSTSNLRGKVYVKVGDGGFVEKGEAAAESKAMKFTKQDISTDVEAGKTVTIRLAIAMLAGKTQKKVTDGVIGGVVIYYDITGTPVAFQGADGDYNIIDYATAAEKTAQGTAIADGKSADGMVSWHNVTYHSDGYGLQILGNKDATITVKVGGPSVISMVSSTYSAGTITVKDKAGNVIASGSTKVDPDKTPFSFLYTGSAADELTVAFSGATSYIGKINVRELTTEKAEIKSVKINGAETVSTATTDGVKFTAAVEATYMASPEVTWSSDDETIATVSSEGLVKGLKAGKTKINAVSKL